jgi:hypothetical protein
MTRFLVMFAVMVLLTVARGTNIGRDIRGPILFLFDALCTNFSADHEFRALANRSFNKPEAE